MSTPDPEETEREALVKLLSGILYGGGSGSMEGTDQFWKYVAEVADEILAARRLSESEIRRDQAEKDVAIVQTSYLSYGMPEKIRAQFAREEQ